MAQQDLAPLSPQELFSLDLFSLFNFDIVHLAKDSMCPANGGGKSYRGTMKNRRTNPRPEKVDKVSSLTKQLKSATSAVFVNYAGLSVKKQQALKKELKAGGAAMLVAKNTLIRLAARDANYPEEATTGAVLAGQTALVISNEDPVAPIQILGKFITTHELPQFKAGVIEGRFADKEGLVKLSKLPGKQVLYAQVVGGVAAPMYGLVATLQGNIQKLVWILQSKSEAQSTKS
jgi:large subunit ribosomal protein L10